METLIQVECILLITLGLLISVRMIFSLRNDRLSYKELYLKVSSENIKLQAENRRLKILVDEEEK